MKVMKFGGTSLGSAERIKNVVSIIRSENNPLVVCSAVSQVTNKLNELARAVFDKKDTAPIVQEIKEKHDAIIKELELEPTLLDSLFAELEQVISSSLLDTAESIDAIQSFGERFSVRIVAALLTKEGVNAQAYDAFDIGMITDDHFGASEPLESSYATMSEKLSGLDHIPIITGFIGKTEEGKVTTLSRGGSDYTAAIIGAAVNAEEIQIWTDVNGVMSTDPRIVPKARTIESLSFDEASELAIFGAKVLHPKSLLPAMQHNIPVRVKNTHEPENTGTCIVPTTEQSKTVAKAIACKRNISLVNVTSTRMLNTHGYLATLFTVFKKHKKSVDMLATSEVSVSMSIDDESNIRNIVQDLKDIARVDVQSNRAIICIVGEGLKEHIGTISTIFSAVEEKGISIEMISQGASKINMSFVVQDSEAESVVQLLHEVLLEQ